MDYIITKVECSITVILEPAPINMTIQNYNEDFGACDKGSWIKVRKAWHVQVFNLSKVGHDHPPRAFFPCPPSFAHLLELVDPLSDKVPKPDSENAENKRRYNGRKAILPK